MNLFGGMRLSRRLSKSKLKFLLGLFIACSLLYTYLPKLMTRLPLGYIGLGLRYDEDFHPQTSFMKESWEGSYQPERQSNKEIVILVWTAWWLDRDPVKVLHTDKCSFLETGTFQEKGKSHVFDLPCRITFDRRYLDYSDALVFHSFDLIWDRLPPRRYPWQFWVYEQGESPIYTRLNLHKYPDTFNWTMTYRRDSDIYDPYGIFVPISHHHEQSESTGNLTTRLKSKHRMAAWIVTSCDSHSKRENLVLELQKYINVDIYGWCGTECPSWNCYAGVQSTHKFYLAFENSLCTDYITEKFFNALQTDMVPVVLGGTDIEDYSAIAPKNSYIDARSFDSPKELANYLIFLDQNDEEYLKYFEWKKSYQVVTENVAFCNLCQRVYEHAKRYRSTQPSWYKNIWKWWNFVKDTPEIEKLESRSPTPDEVSKINGSVCIRPSPNLVGDLEVVPDFEPGLLNGRIFGKWKGWAWDAIF